MCARVFGLLDRMRYLRCDMCMHCAPQLQRQWADLFHFFLRLASLWLLSNIWFARFSASALKIAVGGRPGST